MDDFSTFITFSVTWVGQINEERQQRITSKIEQALTEKVWKKTTHQNVFGTTFRTLPDTLLSEAKKNLGRVAKHYRSEAAITLRVYTDIWTSGTEKL